MATKVDRPALERRKQFLWDLMLTGRLTRRHSQRFMEAQDELVRIQAELDKPDPEEDEW